MWERGGSEDEFISIIENYDGIGGMRCCYESDAHFCCGRDLGSCGEGRWAKNWWSPLI